MKKNDLYSQIPSQVWEKNFVVNSQAIGSSERSIKYLAPYVFKVAISDYRIVNVENRCVRFKYRKSKSCRWRTMELDIIEFMRRYLQHVLSTGFMKIRYFGFLNTNCRIPLQKIAALIQLTFGLLIKEPPQITESSKAPTCSMCGGNLLYRASLRPYFLVEPGAG